TMPLQCATQWDSLAHIMYDNKMYNGYAASEVTSSGAKKNGIENARSKIITRGVLLDIPRFRGKPWLEPGEAVYPEDLDGAAATGKVTVGKGDLVLIRTGQIAQVRTEKSWGQYSGGPAPGLSFSCAPWLCEKQGAGAGGDPGGTDAPETGAPAVSPPLHIVLTGPAGMRGGKICDREERADACARGGVYGFLSAPPPLPITGAVGSPV